MTTDNDVEGQQAMFQYRCMMRSRSGLHSAGTCCRQRENSFFGEVERLLHHVQELGRMATLCTGSSSKQLTLSRKQ